MYVLGCGCTNITVKVKNYWSHQEYTKEGSYEVSEKIKGQATWVLHSKYSKAIWYSGQSANEWVIGDLSDIGTLKGEIFSSGKNGTFSCPYEATNIIYTIQCTTTPQGNKESTVQNHP